MALSKIFVFIVPPKSVSNVHLRLIDTELTSNTNLTSRQLHNRLIKEFPSLIVSIASVKRARRSLGWVCKKTRYCAMIRDANKEKQLEWCCERVSEGDTFSDVIWTDECTVQLESNHAKSYHREGQPAPLNPRPKHPAKVNVWGGISPKGCTNIVIFMGIMTATRYTDILDVGLVPFYN